MTSSTRAASTPSLCHVRATKAALRPDPTSRLSGSGRKRGGPHDGGLRGLRAGKRRSDPSPAQNDDPV